MNQDTEVDQPSMDDVLSPKSSPEFIYVKAKPQTPRASADPITPGLKDIYSKSRLDAVKVLWLIATRRNPQFNIGAIDMSCSFVVFDTKLLVETVGSYKRQTAKLNEIRLGFWE
ncbi:uncharacterized protein FRV6_08403 [Fusarium oxysporum]|uniref:Uncharacterized protein n=1 Tax=Fusarium oxysporum TaxID=5507 RepID=A0A2H3TM20_FUSOX|nr:uncharacterized protein FRV6_08403 [Fusarium oxysporum]